MVQQRRQGVTTCHCRLFGGDIFSREQLRVDGVRVRGAQRFQQRERLRQSPGTGLLDTAAQQDNQNADIFAARQQAAGIPLKLRPVNGFRRTDKIAVLRFFTRCGAREQ